MKKIVLPLLALVLFSSHIMYLKLDSYFLKPNKSATIQLFNGTFDKSENVIDRDRMLDVSLLNNGQRIKVDESQWSEKDSITFLNFRTGEPGTYVVGVSTAPRSIEMDAEAFNTYLEHEGIQDMLAWRRDNDALEGDANERYSKHVKTIFQVGDKRTDDWQKELGYPIEFIPLDNPYELNTGDELKFKLLFKGKPLANQLVYANYKGSSEEHSHGTAENEHSHASKPEEAHSHEKNAEKHSHDHSKEEKHSHDHGKEEGQSHKATEEAYSHDTNSADAHSHDSEAGGHTHTSGQQLRTDSQGMATAKLTADGIWYLQTIHLQNIEGEEITHESNWSTLTFEITHAHGTDTHTHAPAEEGIPAYVYWVGSLFLIAILFFWFNRKK
ncbi:DUF4198 domain-containing protein [Zobellia amurskyensis]|uniref:DUF4198 domain-containing protein n=1 Tax=Zobellia amurskyensis TaxID=248905 RepID=A0A7X2ZS95_9FLAO|nr:DUF4198 domain-containing protein [Zobellia amurskyensis]MUH35471.1 DUF4198 domain-containing protein [Zobellia amurskyensis]